MTTKRKYLIVTPVRNPLWVEQAPGTEQFIKALQDRAKATGNLTKECDLDFVLGMAAVACLRYANDVAELLRQNNSLSLSITEEEIK